MNLKTTFLTILLYAITCQLSAQTVAYGTCPHCWNTDSLGNHRAVLQFTGDGKYAKVIIPWRRRDTDPEHKRIIIQDGKTQHKVLNVKLATVNREKGELYFEPVSGNGLYYVYYMPYKNEGRSNYPKGVYLLPEQTASAKWLSGLAGKKGIPSAVVKQIQSGDSLNSFYPMEVIATAAETAKLIQSHPTDSYLVFPEDRMHPVKMKKDLPQRWIEKGSQNSFSGTALCGEWYAFQMGIYAIDSLSDVHIQFNDLRSATGNLITANHISCINTDGIQYDGSRFAKTVSVSKGTVQAMWCGIQVPVETVPGTYTGTLEVKVAGKPSKTIALTIQVSPQILSDAGAGEPWKQSRLQWLNSTMAQENTVIAPYIPLAVDGNTISLLGRKIALNADGLPAQIQTFFTPEMTGFSDTAKNLFTEAVHFHFDEADSLYKPVWKKSGVTFTQQQPGTVSWESVSSSDRLEMKVTASLEFDGFMNYTVKLTALADDDLKNIRFHLPFTRAASKYMMGLGLKGGIRPSSFDWKWEVATKNQDGAWIGDVNAGLQYSLRDEKYVRPLNTNFYLQKPLLLPTSWGNEGKGGIQVREDKKSVLLNNYCGKRTLKKGDVLYFNFTLLVTPFHPINTDFQWATKFYHQYNNLDSIKATGATVVNIHHATPINPWINYPFIEHNKMKEYVDRAHARGLKVKIYNTVRELSNHAYETFAMRSLGHEIYSTGKGGGYSWLQEHIGDDYIAAWFVPEIKDAALVNSGMSRWHNYYVEGMNWLVQKVGIDGIYLDDVAFDRITMKRIKRVLTQDGHPGIIDLHSANQYNKNDGFNNSANLYMEHFPYLNRLWFGEYFDYEKNSPDFFLTEVSGIPFGLMGEMLQGGGNAWRGMVYGMTNRMPWSDNADPRPIWEIWDLFGMKGSDMIGYWSENCPVKTSDPKVLATVYKKNKSAMVSIASWADSTVDVHLQIDWQKLGIDSSKAQIIAPLITNFQDAAVFNEKDPIPVMKNKGWLLLIVEQAN